MPDTEFKGPIKDDGKTWPLKSLLEAIEKLQKLHWTTNESNQQTKKMAADKNITFVYTDEETVMLLKLIHETNTEII